MTDSDSADGPSVADPYVKTPLYAASNSRRYERQALIRQIQEETQSHLICYIGGARSLITRDDVLPFHDLLRNLDKDTDIDVLLHTIGGDIDATEKLVNMIRDRVGTASFRIVVPDYAKSAGTLMVLGADRVVMSDSSELGPIDPQVVRAEGDGQRVSVSVQHHLAAYDQYAGRLTEAPDDPVATLMLQKFDPAVRQMYMGVARRARQLAETFLVQGMFSDGGGNPTGAAKELLNTDLWHTHSQVISWRDAQNPRIGLVVEYLDPHSELWQRYWRLYCMQRLALDDDQRLYESDCVSLLI